MRNVHPDLDTYVSQGLFDAPCRRALHLAWLTHAYVDLDVYNIPMLPGCLHDSHRDPAWLRSHAAAAICQFCDDEGIFRPSLIIFSGRGIYLKWMWSSPLPRAAAGRAVAVNRALVRRFAALGADPKCVDVSRILRVVGTTNTKNGEKTEILWREEQDGQIATYDFGAFGDEVLQFTTEQIRGFRAERAERDRARIHLMSHERTKRGQVSRRFHCWEDWHWGVVEDIRTLIELRWEGTVPIGHRDLVGHLAACQLARVIPAGQLWNEVLTLGRIILPADYVNGPEFRQHCSTLLANAQRADHGEKVEFEGRLYSPVYTYGRDTLIERLEITPDEMPLMTRLIDCNEKERRKIEKRRLAGMQERAAYEAAANERRVQADVMHAEGLSQRTIAQRLNVSRAEIRRILGTL